MRRWISNLVGRGALFPRPYLSDASTVNNSPPPSLSDRPGDGSPGSASGSPSPEPSDDDWLPIQVRECAWGAVGGSGERRGAKTRTIVPSREVWKHPLYYSELVSLRSPSQGAVSLRSSPHLRRFLLTP